MTAVSERVLPPLVDAPPAHGVALARRRVLRTGICLVDALVIVVVLVAVATGAGVLALLYGALVLGALCLTGSTRSYITPTVANGLGALVANAAWPLLLLGALFAGDGRLPDLLRAAPLVLAGVIAGRWASYAAIRSARRRGLIVERTLIIGSGRVGAKVAELLGRHPEYGLAPVAFLDGLALVDDTGLPVVGDVEDLDAVISDLHVTRVLVAYGTTRSEDVVPAIRACQRQHAEVHVVPRLFELGLDIEGGGSDDIWGIPIMRVKRSALRSQAWRGKRIFDVAGASLALLATSPLFVLIAIAVKATSPGPVFFRQQRVGQGGQPFSIIKFRTLHLNDESDRTWTVIGSDRLTTIGRWLRRTSLDELPQLLNVVRGEMSLVGPRPERRHFVDQFNGSVPRYDDRHRVPVGMTGLAQVHRLRGDTSIEERARFDNHYIEHWSIWRDLVILARTLGAVLRGSHNQDS